MRFAWILLGIALLLVLLNYLFFGGREQCRNCGYYLSRRMTVCPRCGRTVGTEDFFRREENERTRMEDRAFFIRAFLCAADQKKAA